jgi:hypothetical protein
MAAKRRRKVVGDDEGVLKNEVVRELEKRRREAKEGKVINFEEVKKKYGL